MRYTYKIGALRKFVMKFFLGILEVAILVGVVVFFIHRKKKKNLESENNRRLREEEKKKEEAEKAKMLEELREKWDAKKEEFATDGLPIYATDRLHLSKNEECHFIGLAVFVETKKEIVGYRGSGSNLSFELIKGLNRSTVAIGEATLRKKRRRRRAERFI